MIEKILKTNKEGITLIALIITIIVMLILAGVTISMITGEEGMLTKTENAKIENEESGIKEKIRLAVESSKFEKGNYAKITENVLETELTKIGVSEINKSEAGEDGSTLPWKVKKDNVVYKIKQDGSVSGGAGLITYKISFNAKNVIENPADVEVDNDEEWRLPELNIGVYDVIGWYSDEAYQTKIGNPGEVYSPTSDITLYAEWGKKLYDNGNTCTNVTGGWEAKVNHKSNIPQGAGTAKTLSDCIELRIQGGSLNASTHTKNTIDLSQYSKIRIKFNCTENYSDYSTIYCYTLSSTDYTYNNIKNQNLIGSTTLEALNTEVIKLEYNISNINEAYMAIVLDFQEGGGSIKMNILEIELIK